MPRFSPKVFLPITALALMGSSGSCSFSLSGFLDESSDGGCGCSSGGGGSSDGGGGASDGGYADAGGGGSEDSVTSFLLYGELAPHQTYATFGQLLPGSDGRMTVMFGASVAPPPATATIGAASVSGNTWWFASCASMTDPAGDITLSDCSLTQPAGFTSSVEWVLPTYFAATTNGEYVIQQATVVSCTDTSVWRCCSDASSITKIAGPASPSGDIATNAGLNGDYQMATTVSYDSSDGDYQFEALFNFDGRSDESCGTGPGTDCGTGSLFPGSFSGGSAATSLFGTGPYIIEGLGYGELTPGSGSLFVTSQHGNGLYSVVVASGGSDVIYYEATRTYTPPVPESYSFGIFGTNASMNAYATIGTITLNPDSSATIKYSAQLESVTDGGTTLCDTGSSWQSMGCTYALDGAGDVNLDCATGAITCPSEGMGCASGSPAWVLPQNIYFETSHSGTPIGAFDVSDTCVLDPPQGFAQALQGSPVFGPGSSEQNIGALYEWQGYRLYESGSGGSEEFSGAFGATVETSDCPDGELGCYTLSGHTVDQGPYPSSRASVPGNAATASEQVIFGGDNTGSGFYTDATLSGIVYQHLVALNGGGSFVTLGVTTDSMTFVPNPSVGLAVVASADPPQYGTYAFGMGATTSDPAAYVTIGTLDFQAAYDVQIVYETSSVVGGTFAAGPGEANCTFTPYADGSIDISACIDMTTGLASTDALPTQLIPQWPLPPGYALPKLSQYTITSTSVTTDSGGGFATFQGTVPTAINEFEDLYSALDIVVDPSSGGTVSDGLVDADGVGTIDNVTDWSASPPFTDCSYSLSSQTISGCDSGRDYDFVITQDGQKAYAVQTNGGTNAELLVLTLKQ